VHIKEVDTKCSETIWERRKGNIRKRRFWKDGRHLLWQKWHWPLHDRIKRIRSM